MPPSQGVRAGSGADSDGGKLEPADPGAGQHPDPISAAATATLVDTDTLLAFAADLHAATFTVDALNDLLGHEALSSIPLCTVVAERVLQNPGAVDVDRSLDAVCALGTLVLLFVCARPQPVARVQTLFPRSGIAALERIGLLECLDRDGEQWVQTRFDVRPYSFTEDVEESPAHELLPEDGVDAKSMGAREPAGTVNLIVLSDLGTDQTGETLPHNYVLGIGQASLTLAGLVPRARAESALDVGTGCGIQTFHLLRHCSHVTATDISQRALDITQANLILNAHALNLNLENLGERVTLLKGNLLAPVADQRFDLIVSNPPFVITPRGDAEKDADRFTYRDGGQSGDRLLAELVTELPTRLRAGGSAYLLANWEITELDAPFAGPQRWVDRGASSWFVQRETETPAEYALTWLRDAGEDKDPTHYKNQLTRYLEDFASRHVLAVGFGYVLVHQPDNTAPWHRWDVANQAISAPIGHWWALDVEHQQALQALGEEEFGALCLQPREDVTEERHQNPGAEHPSVILLRQGSGWRHTRQLDTASAGFVSACDGTLSVNSIIGALESLLEPVDPNFATALREEVRELVRLGFLNGASRLR